MTKVIPAIIPKNFDHLRGQVMQVKDYVNRVQVDIIDGEFAPEASWPYEGDRGDFDALLAQKEGLPFWKEVTYEFDLMIDGPESVVDDYIQIGASGLIFHYDSTDDVYALIERAKEARIEVGVAFQPHNFAENLDITEIVKKADFIQIMGNDEIGRHGVSLDPSVYDYVEAVRELDPDIDIAVDIGVNETTAPELVASGVTKLVSGSAIFHAENVQQAIENFCNL